MNIILTVDDDWGTRFNNRRQSRDSAVTARILELSAPAALWMSESTARLFPEPPERVVADDGFPAKAAPGDYCFVEDVSLLPPADEIESFILFHWNRRYPSDQKFEPGLLAKGWSLTKASEFPGHSHDKITEEWYCRV